MTIVKYQLLECEFTCNKYMGMYQYVKFHTIGQFEQIWNLFTEPGDNLQHLMAICSCNKMGIVNKGLKDVFIARIF